jgi:CHAT domain-containing protein/tetratricopeptide (TPR) repeat protein
MNDDPTPCQALAAALAAADDPESRLPAVLPCQPLALLIALHAEVTSSMLSDLAQAQRAALAAWAVVRRFPDDPLLQAQAHWSQGSAILYVPDYAGSLEHYDAALLWYDRSCERLAPAIPARDVRVVQIVRVFCLSELGRYREAQAAVAIAERWLQDHPNDYVRLTLLLNRSQLAGTMGEYGVMIDLADEMIALATQLENPARTAHGWINRAFACIYLGRFDEVEQAIAHGIAAATVAEEPLTVGRALANRAVLLRCQGQLFAALTTLDEAERLQAPGEAAMVALDKADIYEQLRQLPDALRSARHAAELFTHQSMPMYSASAALHAARIALQQQQSTVARMLLRLAKTHAAQVDVVSLHAEIALAESALALISRQGVRPKARIRQCRAARAVAQQAVGDLQRLGLVQEAEDGLLTVAALDAVLGDSAAALATYRSLTQQRNPQIRLAAYAGISALLPSAEALPYLQQAAALSIEQRRALPMEELQARYSSETSPYHLCLTAAHLALGDVAQAFEAVCIAKAGPLLDLRAAGRSLGTAANATLESAKATLARWREEERYHTRQVLDAVRHDQHERAEHHIQRVQAAAAEVRASEQVFTAASRMLGDRSGQSRVPNPAEIQAALASGMALLEYAQVDDDLICFLVQPHQPIVLKRLGKSRALAALLDRWSLVCRRLMDDQQPTDARQQVQAVLAPLWDMLIAPWQQALGAATHLLIAPWGMLHHVPWAALFDGTAYLSDRFMLTLTPCAAMWAVPTVPPATSPGPPRLLGYAGSGDDRLSYVAEELDAIARHLPGAQIYLPATSVELRAPSPPSLLHIGAHGLTNPTAPLCSTLELADGPLLLVEAHRLDLHGTRLVVLSACETSVRPDYGEMALALAGAFLCAGAQAVLASLWRIADEATADLMERFYAALAAGISPAAALRLAQQQVRTTYPLDWAAFQLWAGGREI